jgi:hypothetical protein
MVYTRKVTQRGSGGKKSKDVATTQTPAAALGKSVRTMRNSAAELVAAQKEVLKLARDHRSAIAAVKYAQEAVDRTSKYKSASGITAHTKAQAHLKEKEDKLADINRQLEELEGTSSKAAISASRAAENAAGVGLRGEYVLNSRVAAAAAASEAASNAADNMNYAGLSNSARKRLHNADRRATRIAEKRSSADLIKKFKKTKKQLKRALADLTKPGASEALAEHADYLRRFADELHKRVGRKNFSAYAELANYSPKSPASPNSPSDPNSV